MFFDDNLVKLNEKLSIHKISFENNGDKLVMHEEISYALNGLPGLKKELQDLYGLRFTSEGGKYWYIGAEGIKKLSERQLKLKPGKSEEELRTALTGFISQIKDEELRICVNKVLEGNPSYFEAPAAKYYHHAYKNGLLEHSLQVITLSFGLIGTFDKDIIINNDLILAGSILHDIGKINCYKFAEGGIDVTIIYSEQNHIVNGVKIVSQYIQCKSLDDLLHIIASHHKLAEYGSPVSPISNEAWIIHLADELSSKVMG